MKGWERLFARALHVVDSAQSAGQPGIVWSLGGGSALMRRHRHRRSAGVDIFLRDPRMLRRLSPRLNEAVGALSVDHVEESIALRIYFPEGEVAFIACGPLTSDPLRRESILGRSVLVETSAEILAKKLWHRAATFPARDLFDFATVAALEPHELRGVAGVLRVHRAALLQRLQDHGMALREDFAALDAWEFQPGFEECVAALRLALSRGSPPPLLEEQRGPYEIARVRVSRSCRCSLSIQTTRHHGAASTSGASHSIAVPV